MPELIAAKRNQFTTADKGSATFRAWCRHCGWTDRASTETTINAAAHGHITRAHPGSDK